MTFRKAAVFLRSAAAVFILMSASGPASPQTPYSDDELVEGFVLTVFGAEVGDTADDLEAAGRVKKFASPVHYHVVSTARRDWTGTVRAFVTSLSDTVQGLTMSEVETPGAAEMVVYLVDRAAYVATIRSKVWPGVDTRFLETNACSAVIAARSTGIERGFIFLVADEGFVPLSHCMVEEIAQSLGPANDSDALPDSIFNDSSHMNVFGVFDWFILNMLYDPRIVAGMHIDDAVAVLPEIIADARARLPDVMAGTAFAAHEPLRKE